MHLHSGVPAHPRVCGENPAAHAFAFWGSGSSPRVRGKPLDSMSPRRRTRLIPARAGKTHRSNGGSLRPRAHPRACGENLDASPGITLIQGSSPRVRGKRWSQRATRHGWGLIPARAGKTETREFTAIGVPAHPRACGENDAVETIPATLSGSSPRVRGKRRGGDDTGDLERLIPARAGKTDARSSSP